MNSKLILLVLAVSINAEKSYISKCPTNITVQSNFDVKAYSGLWYEFAKYEFFGEPKRKCISVEYTFNNKGTMHVVNKEYELNGTLLSFSYDTERIDNAKYLTELPEIKGVYRAGAYWILGTDYKTYSSAYCCHSMLDAMHFVTVWIYTRERIPSEETIKIAKEVLISQNVNLNSLVETEQKNCP